MDVLLHNPIADMYGPQFLVFYGIVIAIATLVCWKLVQDPTQNAPLPLIPAEPDAYQIAYLRSGVSGVAQVAILNLIQLGYLQITGESINHISNHPPLSELQPLERQVFFIFYTPSQMKTSLWLVTEKIESYCDIYQQQLDNEQLLYANEWNVANMKVGVITAIIIFSLGLYKLLIALSRGYSNVGFLIIMAVSAIIILCALVMNERSRLSCKGIAYRRQLEQTFSQLKHKIKKTSFDNPSTFDYSLVVAIFGIPALAGSSYDSLDKAFFPRTYSPVRSRLSSSDSSSNSSSSCSSGSSCSSSSSCSSGSSCGGGCGGCGGGGGD